MSTNPTTNGTSLKNRPILRVSLIVLWVGIVGYILMVMGMILSPQLTSLLSSSSLMQTILNIPAMITFGLTYGLDFLTLFGFAVIAGLLVVRRSDDWFAIFVQHAVVWKIRIGDVVAILRANAYGEDVNTGSFGFGDHGIKITFVFFAVAEDDECVIFLASFFEGVHSEADSIC